MGTKWRKKMLEKDCLSIQDLKRDDMKARLDSHKKPTMFHVICDERMWTEYYIVGGILIVCRIKFGTISHLSGGIM